MLAMMLAVSVSDSLHACRSLSSRRYACNLRGIGRIWSDSSCSGAGRVGYKIGGSEEAEALLRVGMSKFKCSF